MFGIKESQWRAMPEPMMYPPALPRQTTPTQKRPYQEYETIQPPKAKRNKLSTPPQNLPFPPYETFEQWSKRDPQILTPSPLQPIQTPPSQKRPLPPNDALQTPTPKRMKTTLSPHLLSSPNESPDLWLNNKNQNQNRNQNKNKIITAQNLHDSNHTQSPPQNSRTRNHAEAEIAEEHCLTNKGKIRFSRFFSDERVARAYLWYVESVSEEVRVEWMREQLENDLEAGERIEEFFVWWRFL